MSMHTPGTWQHDRRTIFVELPGEEFQRVIANVWSGGASSFPEAEANGRLIAAAPLLLSALEALVAAVRMPTDKGLSLSLAAATQAIAATRHPARPAGGCAL
ncbi:MAG: hypothetical protein MUF08_00610 [Burkholderiaceae bacterium]|jgi:hypothetical protein|nr:hypothetical protein [Burkholderiaceae bacterium]